jgi:hypothetical protein
MTWTARKRATTFDAGNGDKVRRLWTGDTSNHGGDESAADLALVSSLAFWTDDAAQIERLWLASPLGDRAKTQDRTDYRSRTIAKALAGTPLRLTPLEHRNGYAPGPNGHAPAPCPDTPDPCVAQMAALEGRVSELERLLGNRDMTIQTLQRERDEARAILSLQCACFRHVFQSVTPCWSRSKCSGFAMATKSSLKYTF